jgi:dipeptidase E
MFTLFLTSSPCGHDGAIFEKNRFREELLRQLKGEVRGLYITSDPDDFYGSECASNGLRSALENCGIHITQWTLLDKRNISESHRLVSESDLIILGGGHVPTQHRFFTEMQLRESLLQFKGTLITISAGSMNCADTVYSIPELPGEIRDPKYKRFFPGMGLTNIQILPHYYEWKDFVLDGMKVYNEVAAKDSIGKRFYIFPDGTYLYSMFGYEEIRGEAFLMENGIFRKICEDGQHILLPII